MDIAEAVTTVKKPTAKTAHLPHLDGIRGLAALYVVLHHAHLELRFVHGLAGANLWLLKLLRLLEFGHYAVAVFIVLSGYCLMLPVISRASGQVSGGFRNYIGRRARRILPPYYAALILSILLIGLLHFLKASVASLSALYVEQITPVALISHLLLVDNLSQSLCHSLNPPLWSVATEWQIYFIFPLILLPVWRRLGSVATIIAGFLLGLLPHFLFHGWLDSAALWYIGLFALGMVGADLSFSNDPRKYALCRRAPWGWLSFLVGGGFCLAGILNKGWLNAHWWYSDPIVGIATICLLIWSTRHQRQHPNNDVSSPIVRLLGSRQIVGLGLFSYSLYLIHYPLLLFINALLDLLHLPINTLIGTTLLVEVPLIVLLAYGFALVFERRFLVARSILL